MRNRTTKCVLSVPVRVIPTALCKYAIMYRDTVNNGRGKETSPHQRHVTSKTTIYYEIGSHSYIGFCQSFSCEWL